MPFCGNCGAPVDPGKMRFCPRCGTPIEAEFTISPPPVPPTSPTTTGPTSPTTTMPPPPMIQSDLFDPRRSGYVINEKTWDWGWGDILDETGQKIGSMERKILSLRAEIRLRELDGTLTAKIHRKIVAIRPTYEIKDPNDRIIGKIEKKLLSVFRPKLFVQDGSGNKLLQIKGNLLRWDFNILDMHGNQVGTVKKMDKWHDVFFGGGMFDRSDKYALRIHSSHDRRLVVGAVIAIDNMFHDETD